MARYCSSSDCSGACALEQKELKKRSLDIEPEIYLLSEADGSSKEDHEHSELLVILRRNDSCLFALGVQLRVKIVFIYRLHRLLGVLSILK